MTERLFSSNDMQRLIRPEALSKDEVLIWSPGRGKEVWELIIAAGTGNLNKAKQLLDDNPALIRSSYEYRQPLTFAVQRNQLEMAAFLLERGANPFNSGTPDSLLEISLDRGYAEMHDLLEAALTGKAHTLPGAETIAEAIRNRDVFFVIDSLKQSPELLNAIDSTGNQPIHWAVMTRQPDLVDELINHGADINAKRFDGAAPVQLVNGDYNYRGWTKNFQLSAAGMLEHLRKRGAFIDICTAAAIGDLAQVQALVDKDPSLVNRVSDYVSYYIGSGAPIKNAAARGHIDIVQLLLERGADPNLPEEGIAPQGHALHSAVCNGHIEIVQLLLDHGAYPNVEIESSADTLSAAIQRGNKPMIELLCSYGASRKVHLLAYYGDIVTAAAVFAADPSKAEDVNAMENAAGEGHEAFVKLMLKYQPELPKRLAVGVSSRGPGEAAKTREIAELLFAHGMNASFPNWLRITPLHRFAQKGDTENAVIFLAHGADLEAVDEEICSTPLGWAAKFGQLPMVKLLISHGAEVHPSGVQAWSTPLQWAIRRKHPEIEELLNKHIAAKY